MLEPQNLEGLAMKARHIREQCWKLHDKPFTSSKEWGYNGVSNETFANSWVTDLGATNHMTHSSHQFNNYNPCLSYGKIATTDDSLTTVAGVGDVQISPTFTLRNVLHVPKLSTNS
ncbi:hypothetical protein CK203_105384 [Vitis vinifera]|uniref:Retrovirus-related Pol polyprotein from transposon TNT 1-94-like beta-barrel domain-containing protein n=1 Tax=Vitis vinifera TaxID=29760 RepID=A0A438DDN2_VITVI|nr:hypothetical protein CK203_105384 [Vitis vinifera]